MKNGEVQRLETVIGRVLLAGSIASTAILLAGLALALAIPTWEPARAIIRAGLIVLLLTPVARVVASVVEFSRDRDWLFAALAVAVLVIVVSSILLGRA